MKVLTIQQEQRNAFFRITFAAVFGVSIGHLFNFESTSIIFSLYALKLMFIPGRFNFVIIMKQLFTLVLGMVMGLILGNISGYFPIATALLMLMFCLFTLDCNRKEKLIGYSYNIFLTTTFVSINSSYSKPFYLFVNQYLLQIGLLFILVLILHLLFPSSQSTPIPTPSKVANITTTNMFIDAVILCSFWIFSMLFEWRFAFFAFVTVASLYENYDYKMIVEKCKINIKVHAQACLLASLFSLLLFGMTGNWLLFSLGLFLVYSPFVYKIVYKRENVYFNASFLFGLTVPFSLYLTTSSSAIVYQSQLRATLILGTMLITIFFIKLRGKRCILEVESE